jgi:hypothetical protein
MEPKGETAVYGMHQVLLHGLTASSQDYWHPA